MGQCRDIIKPNVLIPMETLTQFIIGELRNVHIYNSYMAFFFLEITIRMHPTPYRQMFLRSNA